MDTDESIFINHPLAMSADRLRALMTGDGHPLVIDVRRPERWNEAGDMLPQAIRRVPDHVADWGPGVDLARPVVVYCVYGHEVGRDTATALRAQGYDAWFLAGGIEGWRSGGGKLAPKRTTPPSLWVTRERPKIDRIACPWLIRRFVDPEAQFLYVKPADVLTVAQQTGATPYDIPGVALSHVGERCSFDAVIDRYQLGGDQALQRLADIVRGADTERPELTPQSPGLLALSLGLGALIADDQRLLRQGLVVYDALYVWCRKLQGERHAWPPVMSAA